MAAKDVVLYDWAGYELTLPKAPDKESQAEIGKRADPWASKAVRDISPETLARIGQNTAPLQDHSALCDKIYLDAHFQSIAEDYVSSIAGLDWDLAPFVDSPGAKPLAEDVKVAQSIAEKLYNAPGLDQYVEHLAWGDGLYPVAGAETIWDPSTYLPLRFELADAVRWSWKDRELRLLTVASPREGEPLKPANWTLHSRNPQNPRKTRMYKALAFYQMCTRYAVVDLLALSEKFGKPIPIAYFEDPNDRDKVVEAVMQIGTDFAGVFPASVKVELQQALDLKSNIQQGLAQFGMDQATKLVCGHVLIVDAKSGSGTLAGEGAQKTNLKRTKAGAARVAGSIKQGLIRPLAWFHHGKRALDRLPSLVFKVTPPEDVEKKARSFVAWNQALEPSGLAIDPEHIKEQAGVPKLVARATPSAAPGAPAAAKDDAASATDPANAAPAAGADPSAGVPTTQVLTGIAIREIRDTLKDLAAGFIVRDAAISCLTGAGLAREEAEHVVDATIEGRPAIDTQGVSANDPAAPKTPAAQRTTMRPAMQAGDTTPKIRTLADVIAASTIVGARAASDQSAHILSAARQAAEDGKSVREFLDSLWEDYDAQPDMTKAAELLAQSMVVAEAIGAGDAAAQAKGDE